MEHQTIKYGILPVVFISLLALASCYNDNYQDLYPSGPCDTTQVSYAKDIWPVISSQCTGCHSGSVPAGNIPLEKYADVIVLVKNGKLLGSIRWDKGFSPMPKGGAKLSGCTIAKFEKWIADGTPDN